MTALFKPSDFDPQRARETAKRIREGVSPVPMFTETRKGVGDRVISNIGWAMPSARATLTKAEGTER